MRGCVFYVSRLKLPRRHGSHAGQYEVAVEAGQHEPFRRRLAVEGPTAYRISLCKKAARTKRVCDGKKVQRFLTKTRYKIKTKTIKRRSVKVYTTSIDDESDCYWALKEFADAKFDGTVVNYQHYHRLTEFMSYGQVRRGCERDGGRFFRYQKRIGGDDEWEAKTTCSCSCGGLDSLTGLEAVLSCFINVAMQIQGKRQSSLYRHRKNVHRYTRCPDGLSPRHGCQVTIGLPSDGPCEKSRQGRVCRPT